jgi:hypothetical protein
MLPLFVTIDRFENDKAVLILSDGQQVVIERQFLPMSAKAGDCLTITFKHNDKKTAEREQKVSQLLSKIFKQNS